VCVYTHTHTHTAQMGYLDVSPGVGMRHLEGPKNPDGLNKSWHICIKSWHVCNYYADDQGYCPGVSVVQAGPKIVLPNR